LTTYPLLAQVVSWESNQSW